MQGKCRLQVAKDGKKVPVVEFEQKELILGSLYDGHHAAERWVSYHICDGIENVILFGMGDCQIVLEILCRIPGYLVVYEPNENVYQQMRHTSVFKKMQKNGKMQIFSGHESWEDMVTAVHEILNENAIETTSICIHWGYVHIYGSEIQKLQMDYQRACEAIVSLKPSVKRFAPAMIRNQIANIRNMKGGILLGRLRKYWNRDTPVILVSAGPSLEKNIEQLKKVEGRALIFSVDAALSLLLKHDIIPDLVACVDANKNEDCFSDSRSIDIPMLVSGNTPAGLVKRNRATKIWGYSPAFVHELYQRCDFELPLISVNLGVATMLLATLIDLGTKKIVLVGQDLAYSEDGRSHISGRNEGVVKDEQYKTEGYYGGEVWSRRDWTLTREWMECVIQAADSVNGRKIINATEGGAKIHGAIQRSMQEVVDELETHNTGWQDILCDEHVHIQSKEYERLMAEFAQGKQELERMKENGYHQTFFERDYRNIPVMNLLFDYMRSLDDEKRENRFEKALDFVYREYCKELEKNG